MQLRSQSALFAALLGDVTHLMLTTQIATGGGRDSAEDVESVLVGVLLVSPSLIALAAAFSTSPTFRAAALTAAFAGSLAPMLVLLYFVIGILYLPGTLALLIAAIMNLARVRRLLPAFVSLIVGLAAGISLTASWIPLLGSYDACANSKHVGWRGGREIVECHGALSLHDVGLALALVLAALGALWLTTHISASGKRQQFSLPEGGSQ